MQVRKAVKNRGHFPSDKAATKLLLLALRNLAKKWTAPQRTWNEAANQFAIVFGDRFTACAVNQTDLTHKNGMDPRRTGLGLHCSQGFD